MRILLVVNPAASSVTPRAHAAVRDALSVGHDLRVAQTTGRGHATELARAAAGDGPEVVVVLGGDGTLNEAANGLLGTTCALAVLPGGSTNVFARTIGMPNDAVAGVPVLLAALARGSFEPIDVGTANGRAFLFHAGLGFDASVVEEVERHPRLKRWGRRDLFVVAALDTWLRHVDRTRPLLAVHLPGGVTVEDGYYAIVLNTDPYTYLGKRPIRVAPDAGLHRPLVAVVIRSLRLWTLSRILRSALRADGGVQSHAAVSYVPGLAELRVVGHRPFPYQLDGDHLGYVDELSFRHLPDALCLVRV